MMGIGLSQTLLSSGTMLYPRMIRMGFVFNSIGITDENDNMVAAFRGRFKEGILQGDYLLKKVFFRSWYFGSPVYGRSDGEKGID